MEFLDGHGLELDFEVEGADGDAAVFLPGPDPGFFHDFDIRDAAAGDDEVGVCVGDVVAHAERYLGGWIEGIKLWDEEVFGFVEGKEHNYWLVYVGCSCSGRRVGR